MIVYLKRRNTQVNATAEYDIASGKTIVKKGSIVSNEVKHTEKFRGASTIEKYRKEYVRDSKTLTDVEFKSASTAANFVTGGSTNGLVAWKNENGESLKSMLQSNEE